jgi:SAM-dependent methyltransferase
VSEPEVIGWERIPEDVWRAQTGHVERYEWAASLVRPGETVLDVACGIGYGAEILFPRAGSYIGVDRPGVPSATFAELGTFIETDIDSWTPRFGFDVAVCFETLEHVRKPERLAKIISKARRLVLVSVPTVPTVGINRWHFRDFTEESLPELFPTLTLLEVRPQPQERSHIYTFAPLDEAKSKA